MRWPLSSDLPIHEFLPLQNENPSRISVRIWDEIEPLLEAAINKLDHLFLQRICAYHNKLFWWKHLMVSRLFLSWRVMDHRWQPTANRRFWYQEGTIHLKLFYFEEHKLIFGILSDLEDLTDLRWRLNLQSLLLGLWSCTSPQFLSFFDLFPHGFSVFNYYLSQLGFDCAHNQLRLEGLAFRSLNQICPDYSSSLSASLDRFKRIGFFCIINFNYKILLF